MRSAINAELGGADRVELCDNLWEGGTTPSIGSIELAIERLSIPVFVLIRPRGGDFAYSDMEFELIKRDINRAIDAGAKGIVSGVITANGSVDVRRTRELVALTKPLPFTFHRAFDLVEKPEKALEELIEMGVDRVLTSGQAASAVDGLPIINQLVDQAGDRVTILPGGGITSQNIHQFAEVGCREFHFSAKRAFPGSMKHKVPMNGSKDIPENEIFVSDPDKIRAIKNLLDEMD